MDARDRWTGRLSGVHRWLRRAAPSRGMRLRDCNGFRDPPRRWLHLLPVRDGSLRTCRPGRRWQPCRVWLTLRARSPAALTHGTLKARLTAARWLMPPRLEAPLPVELERPWGLPRHRKRRLRPCVNQPARQRALAWAVDWEAALGDVQWSQPELPA